MISIQKCAAKISKSIQCVLLKPVGFSMLCFFMGGLSLFVACSTKPSRENTAPKVLKTNDFSQRAPSPRVVFVDENEVGRMMAAQIAGNLKLDFKDKKLLKYVNMVGQTLVEQAGRPGVQFRFGILETIEPEILSTPSGHIFISKGFLKALTSEHELAGFLAAEIAHINEHHHQDMFVTRRTDGIEEVTLSEARQVEVGVERLTTESFAKDTEFEGDAAASIYIATTGYTPMYWLYAMKRLSQNSAFRTKPTFKLLAERAQNLEGFLKRNGLARVGFADDKILKKRFAASL